MRNEMMNRNGDMGNWFNDFGDMFHNFGSFPKMNMKADISETDKEYLVKVDMPDMNKDDIKISYTDGVLSVSGKRESFSDHEDNKGNLLMSERSYGQFSRSFRLPNADKSGITANYKDGTLNITLPKNEESKNGDNFIKID
ncbi:Hsp20/alpha crystallin family protein [Companilactobacillus sp. DQM5]|uniref:Hsp20/alpha crystallin family protein n=1 Tax=Companilactobacillus sp. DQM5 TaxID=3463359 RepID=UPI004059159C